MRPGPHLENSHPTVTAHWPCCHFRWVYLGLAGPLHGCSQKRFLWLHWRYHLAIFFIIQMGGFCISPVKRNQVEIWLLRHPHSSEPSPCICDWWRKNADGAAGPSPTHAGPHTTGHLLLYRNQLQSPTGALGRARLSPTECQLSPFPIRRLPSSCLLSLGWIQKTG